MLQSRYLYYVKIPTRYAITYLYYNQYLVYLYYNQDTYTMIKIPIL